MLFRDFARTAAVVEHRLAQHGLPQAERVDLVGLEGRMLPLDDDLDHLARALALAAVEAGDEDEIAGRDVGDPHLAAVQDQLIAIPAYPRLDAARIGADRKSTRLNSSH